MSDSCFVFCAQMEMRAPYKTSEETDLMNLLRSPFVKV